MSTNSIQSSIFASNNNENIIASNEQSYDEFIGYCALRKQLERIIPSYYTEIQKQSNRNKRKSISNMEEHRKLKEEINRMKESIELLKELKHKKLQQIEELRTLMRKVGNKQLNFNSKKQINYTNNNNINNKYSCREKQEPRNCFRCQEKNETNCFKVSSDEGISLAPTTSGLSSGKDDEMGGDDLGNPRAHYDDISSNSSSNGRCCFVSCVWQDKEKPNPNPEHYSTTKLSSN